VIILRISIMLNSCFVLVALNDPHHPETAAIAARLIGGQSNFGILVNSRLSVANYTDDLPKESSASTQETQFLFQV